MIQDIEPKHLYNEWKKNAVPKKSSAVVQFRGQDLLCRIDDNGLKFPSRSQFTEPDEAFTYLFELDGREYYLLFDENERALDGYSYRNIGLFRTEKPKELAYAAVSAWHLCSWYRDARYCGRCGEKLVHDGNERMMRAEVRQHDLPAHQPVGHRGRDARGLPAAHKVRQPPRRDTHGTCRGLYRVCREL